MSDALVSPSVFIPVGILSVGLLGTAVYFLKHTSEKSTTNDDKEQLLPLMGVMGAFIFAAQMVNFSIPGTGSSGHIVGGILLAAILGPWAALLTLSSVLVLQCLMFADGGFMALGCNIFNMAVLSTLVAYPLVFRPIMRRNASFPRILTASIAASVVALLLGTLAVTAETEFSGITALPWGKFLLFMLPIHLLIGVGEGLATAAVIYVVQVNRPELLVSSRTKNHARNLAGFDMTRSLVAISVVALLIGASFSWLTSSRPGGMEWAIEKVTNSTPAALEQAASVTVVTPEYFTSFSGIIGCSILLLIALAAGIFIGSRHQKS